MDGGKSGTTAYKPICNRQALPRSDQLMQRRPGGSLGDFSAPSPASAVCPLPGLACRVPVSGIRHLHQIHGNEGPETRDCDLDSATQPRGTVMAGRCRRRSETGVGFRDACSAVCNPSRCFVALCLAPRRLGFPTRPTSRTKQRQALSFRVQAQAPRCNWSGTEVEIEIYHHQPHPTICDGH
jgi:hypothetical protein